MNYAIKNNVNHGRENGKWKHMHIEVDRFCKSLQTTAGTQGIVPKVHLIFTGNLTRHTYLLQS